MKIKHFFFILTLLTSCVSNNTIKETPEYGWISENKFTTKAKGYPELGISASLMEESAFNAAFSLAKTKIEYAFLKEAHKNIDKNKLKEAINIHSKVVYSKYIDNKYVDMVVMIEYKGLKKMLASSQIDIMSN